MKTAHEITTDIIRNFDDRDMNSEFECLKGLLLADHAMDTEEREAYQKVIDTRLIAQRMDTMNAKGLLAFWNDKTEGDELNFDLPETCFTYVETEGKICIIKRGEPGFCNPGKVGGGYDGDKALAAKMNHGKQVNRFQQEAMESGSMFGWGIQAADPRHCFDQFIVRLTITANRTF